MSVRLLGGRLTLDLLLLPAVALFFYVYGAEVCVCFTFALIVHEFAHALTARVVGARIISIELLPFGCAARLEGIGALSGAKEAAVAAAGPLVSIALAAGANMLAGESIFLAMLARLSLGLSAVNLIPVPPLDGGRVFCALLGLAVSKPKAERIAAVMGIIAGGLLIGVFIYLACMDVLNITLPIMGIFMLSSSIRRMKSAKYVFARQLFSRKSELKRRAILDVRHIAAPEDRPASELLSRLDPHRYNIIHLIDEDMHTVHTMDEGELFDTLISGERK